MALIPTRKNSLLLSRLKFLLSSKIYIHDFSEPGSQEQSSLSSKNKRKNLHLHSASISSYESALGTIDISQWKKLDSRTLGITSSMIPEPSWIVLKILQNKGFKAYLVGGCVRDLILNRKPKDFDIITSASLKEVRKQFNRSRIVGQRFPICMVHIKKSVIEVSSFETGARGTNKNVRFLAVKSLRCQKSDFDLWRDCMSRDFTVNSLFFNPFANTIYDFANGLVDLKSLKLRTLVPAHTSFTEDNARILRAVRIAARLHLSFSEDIETAVCDLSSSVMSISESRIMMELNYMLSYGAGQPSLSLLQRLGLLEILLPFQAAYLTRQGKKYNEHSTMLMKLLYNLDRLVSCERPSDSSLWIGLFAFHMALVEQPQHLLVVLALASALYYENWKKAVHFARLQVQIPINYEPEILETTDILSDDELAERVQQLALLIQESINVLIDADSLHGTMTNFAGFGFSGLVFVPRNMKSYVASVFEGPLESIKHDKKGRKSFDIDYQMLRKRDIEVSRFVTGKIIMEAMGYQTDHDIRHMPVSDPEHMHMFEESFCTQPDMANDDSIANGYETPSISMNMKLKNKARRYLIEKKIDQEAANSNLKVSIRDDQCISKDCRAGKQVSLSAPQSPAEEVLTSSDNVLKKQESQDLQERKRHKVKNKDNMHMTGNSEVRGKGVSQNEAVKLQTTVEKCQGNDDNTQNQCSSSLNNLTRENNKLKSQASKEKGNQLRLSDIFK